MLEELLLGFQKFIHEAYPVFISCNIIIMMVTAFVSAFAKHKNEKVLDMIPLFPLAYPIMLWLLITDWNGNK